MSRPLHGSKIQIDSNSTTLKKNEQTGEEERVSDFPEAWGQHETVVARTLFTQGDRQWINAHSSSATFDKDSPDGVKVELDSIASMSATVAKMVISWSLTRDRLDENGNPFDRGDGKYVQEPIVLPDKPEQRLSVIAAMHEDDITYIFQKIMEGKPKPKTAEEQKSFLTSAIAPILTS
jgi:hypothetical protein